MPPGAIMHFTECASYVVGDVARVLFLVKRRRVSQWICAMQSSSSRPVQQTHEQRIWRWSILFLVCSALLLTGSTFYRLRPENIAYSEDIGLSIAVGKEVLRGHLPLLGPPSHAGGRHLGPVYYYFVALGLKLAGEDIYRACLFYSVVHLLGIFIAAFALSGLSRKENRCWSAAGVLLLASSVHTLDIVRAPWHSHFLIFTGALFLASEVLALARPIAALPFVSLTATLLLQAHFSSLPLIGGFLFCNVATTISGMRTGSVRVGEWRQWQLWHYASIGMAMLLWLPLLYYKRVYSLPGVPGFLEIHRDVARIGLTSAAVALGKMYENFLFGVHFAALPHLANQASGYLFALVLLFFCCWVGRRELVVRRFLIAAAYASLLYLAIVSVLPAPLYVYYLIALLPAILILGAIALSGMVTALSEGSRATKLLALVTLCFFACLSGNRVLKTISRYEGVPVFRYLSLKHALEVAELVNITKRTETATLLCDANSALMSGAFYSLLSERNFSKIENWSTLRELPQRPTTCDDLYLIACPQIYSSRLASILTPFGATLAEDRTFSARACPTCANCLVRRYSRSSCNTS